MSHNLESLVPYEYFIAKIKAVLSEYGYGELNDLIFSMVQFKDSGMYDVLFDNQSGDDGNRTISLGKKISKKMIFDVDLIARARRALNNPNLYPFFKKTLIDFPDFYFLYKFLELCYFLNLMHKLEEEDLEKLYFCGIDKILVHNLDNLENGESCEIDDDFFIRLKNLDWEHNESKSFFLDLNNARIDLFYTSGTFSDDITFSSRRSPRGSIYTRIIPTFSPLNKRSFLIANLTRGGARYLYSINPFNFLFAPYDNPNLNFPATENSFLLFLAGCSAVNDKRDKINKSDVVKAYKTYFKLLSADISGLVDNLWEEQLE